MRVHELQTVNLKLRPSKTVRCLSNTGKRQNPLLESPTQSSTNYPKGPSWEPDKRYNEG